MSRPPVRLSAEELLRHLSGKLDNLAGMCKNYDEGNTYVAYSMATEIRKILTENVEAQRARGNRRFRSYSDNPRQRQNLAAMLKQLQYNFGLEGGPPAIFRARSNLVMGEPRNAILLDFREWWNRDLVYCGRAVPPDTPPNQWPADGETIPWEQRDKLTRRQLIDMVRNKVGAHIAGEIPAVLDDLQASKMLGAVFAVPNPDGGEDLTTANGGMVIRIGPIEAMLRATAEEVLIAYGRKPDPFENH